MMLRASLQRSLYLRPYHRTIKTESEEITEKANRAIRLRIKSSSSTSSSLWSLRPDYHKTRFPLKDKFCTGPYEQPGVLRPLYPKRKSPFKRAQAIIDALNVEEGAKLVRSGRAIVPRCIPRMRSGDIVRVGYVTSMMKKRIHYFTGICIAVRKKGLGSTFILRNVVDGIPTERGFPTYSPLIKEAEVIDHRDVNRCKLYYLREKPLRESAIAGALKGPPREDDSTPSHKKKSKRRK